MPHVHETITIDANPNDVWQLAGDPGRIAEWLPVLEKSSLAGDRRDCTLADGGELVERFPEVEAVAVRLVVVDNQCTGNPAFQGDRDQDPTSGGARTRCQPPNTARFAIRSLGKPDSRPTGCQ